MPLLTTYTNPLRGIWQITESSEELLILLNDKDIYQSGLDILKTEKRRQEWLSTRLLLKELLGEEHRIAYHDNDAPYLPDSIYSISISHTQGYAAVLLQYKPHAGIDIERRGDRILKVRERFMSEAESANINKANEADHLLIYWCAKEALFKMIGKEEVDFKRHLHIHPFPFAMSGILTASESRTLETSVYQLSYEIHSDFIIVWSF